MPRWIVAVGLALLGACAQAPPRADASLFDDAAFAPALPTPGADQIFGMSAAMRAYLDGPIAQAMRQGDPRRRMVEMLYRKRELALEYDSSSTRTASEAFAAHAGNCLSLVIMTAAFAKALDMPVRFQHVYVDDAWSRGAGMLFASNHVNLALEEFAPAPLARVVEPTLVVDFLPGADVAGLRTETLDEATIVAMFLNNRAAEALVGGAVAPAYWNARAAIVRDPSFASAYNTLAVVYLRSGHAGAAERALQALLRIEPKNANALANLVLALRAQGREAEAAAASARLARLEPVPPFHWFNAGLQAMERGDYAAARASFEREIEREPDYHEFHFWLARAELALGHPEIARRELERALQDSTTQHEHAIYAAKLDRLEAQTRSR